MTMKRERWEQVDTILQAALELATADRDAFLTARCGDDTELLKEIRSLLELESQAESFIERPAVESVSNSFLSTTNEFSNVLIGKYRLQHEIGRGGMGAVYLAYRDDDEFRQQVALKIIKRGMDTDEILGRFRQERQILADLNHPNIARLIDGGTTEDGLPYFAMEHVDGMPIDRFCSAYELNVERRLETFRDVCAAVQYAHQRLVVHRDLKPSNILVDTEGVPKLLDFGIAKLLTADADNTTTKFRALTPKYASPEQVNGSTITTATDVYSLGVVLRELLNGNCELVSDLEAIIQTAVRQEPERRYASAEHLSNDIGRFLAGLPVAAQRDSFAYRAEKFVRRNKFGVAAAAGVAASLIGGVIATTRQSRIAARQRDRAREAARRAEQINVFLRDMLASADPRAKGKDVTVAQILDVAASQLESNLADFPDVYADLQSTIGMTYFGLGLLEKAEPFLRSSLNIKTKLFGRNGPERAKCLSDLGRLCQEKGELESAEARFTEALAILRNTYRGAHPDSANALNNLGGISLMKGNLNNAVRYHREEIAIRQKLFGNIHPDLIRSLNDLAVVFGTMGSKAEAERLHREALEIALKVYDSDHPDVALAMTTLASAVEHRKPDEALQLFERALSMRRKLLGDAHPDTAWTLYNYAYLLTDLHDYEKAETLCDEVLSMRGSTLPAGHPMIHSTLLVLGKIKMANEEFSEAEKCFRECLDLRYELFDKNHWLVAMARGWLAECVSKRGGGIEAQKLFGESLRVLESWFGTGHERYRQIHTMATAYKS